MGRSEPNMTIDIVKQFMEEQKMKWDKGGLEDRGGPDVDYLFERGVHVYYGLILLRGRDEDWENRIEIKLDQDGELQIRYGDGKFHTLQPQDVERLEE